MAEYWKNSIVALPAQNYSKFAQKEKYKQHQQILNIALNVKYQIALT